jgi:sec-independent protein translocase protein TatB
MTSVIEGMEFFVILLVALVVLGPARLPEMARKVGNWTAEMRRAANEIRQGLEAEVGDVREIAREIREPLREVKDTVRDTKKVIDEDVAPRTWVGPKPISGPTPEDAMADFERIKSGEDLLAAPEATPTEAGDEPDATVPEPDSERPTAEGGAA